MSEFTFSDNSVELGHRACYEMIHPKLEGGFRPPKRKAYVVGKKGRNPEGVSRS